MTQTLVSRYVPFSLLVTFASIIGFNYGVYHEGKFAFEDVYLYAILVRNWSQVLNPCTLSCVAVA